MPTLSVMLLREGRLNNRGIAGEGVTVLHNSVGANKRARNRIQQQLTEVSFILNWFCANIVYSNNNNLHVLHSLRLSCDICAVT